MNDKPTMMQDHSGKPSTMRMMNVLSLFASMVFGYMAMAHPVASQGENGIYITFGFLVGAFAPKAIQSFSENKIMKGKRND